MFIYVHNSLYENFKILYPANTHVAFRLVLDSVSSLVAHYAEKRAYDEQIDLKIKERQALYMYTMISIFGTLTYTYICNFSRPLRRTVKCLTSLDLALKPLT